MSSEDLPNTKGEKTNQSRLTGLQLLALVKNKKQTEAILLLDEKPDVTCKDKAGWTALHYAAGGGYTDLVEILINNGAKVNICDKNKETALHKAARHGHVSSVVVLVAHGSKIEKYDKDGQTPLEHAVKSRNIDVVKTLFSFGAEPVLQDWTWTMEDLDKKGNEVLDLLIEQHRRQPGFKYGAINQTLLWVSSGNDIILANMKSTIVTTSFSLPYYMQFCKMHSEYSDILDKLREEHEIFSDTYELTIWHSCQQAVTIKLAVSGICHCNEKLHIVTLEGKPANIIKVEKFIEETEKQDQSYSCKKILGEIIVGFCKKKKTFNEKAENPFVLYTEVTVDVNLEENKKVRFCIVKQRTPEVFSISEQPVTIIPEMEPETEIQIPKGTFQEPGEMAINIVQTHDVNSEEGKGNAMLLTNVLDLTISNSQQPQESIRVAIPMHEDENSTYDLVVLTSKCDQPEAIEDWEVKEAHTDQDRKSAFFYIDHFSFYSVVARKKAEKNLTDVVDALERSLSRKKRVIFFLMTTCRHKDSSEMVVECTGPRQVDQRIQIWIENGYDRSTLQKSDIYHAQIGQRFKERKVTIAVGMAKVSPNHSEKRTEFLTLVEEITDLQYRLPPVGMLHLSYIHFELKMKQKSSNMHQVQLHFLGNLTETSGEKMHSMSFQNNRNNYHVFTIGVNNNDLPPEGRLEILQEKVEDVPKTVPVVKPKSFWCSSEEPNIKSPSTTSIIESILEMNIKLEEKIDIPPDISEDTIDDVENDEEDDDELQDDQDDETEQNESDNLRQSNEMNHSKMENLKQTIFKGGKPVNVLAIKTKKKGYIR